MILLTGPVVAVQEGVFLQSQICEALLLDLDPGYVGTQKEVVHKGGQLIWVQNIYVSDIF